MGQIEYKNEELGFAFSYPKKYGQVFTSITKGSEGGMADLYVFQMESPCDGCEKLNLDSDVNYFKLAMTSPGLFEIGATNKSFGGIGTGRPLAFSYGFDVISANFEAKSTKGLVSTTNDDMHDQVTTRIEFNLTKSSLATGIEFMTNDKPGQTTNAENLKDIASTFRTIE